MLAYHCGCAFSRPFCIFRSILSANYEKQFEFFSRLHKNEKQFDSSNAFNIQTFPLQHLAPAWLDKPSDEMPNPQQR